MSGVYLAGGFIGAWLALRSIVEVCNSMDIGFQRAEYGWFD
jgi:hypothetical protein